MRDFFAKVYFEEMAKQTMLSDMFTSITKEEKEDRVARQFIKLNANI